MLSNKMLYYFANKFVNAYDTAKNEVDIEELDEMDITLDEYLESVGAVEKAGLQAIVTDDFVKMLSPALQEKIIIECMEQKTNRSMCV